ncbi:MAG TPA: twin transmembrane helix small protein [Gammaproteobacteria bacterium]
MSLAFIFKLIVFLLLAIIIVSLASGMFFLVRDKGSSDNTVKSLTVRISLSILLFILLFIGMATGLIEPHGLFPEQATETERALQ